jgi:hypothetical protein
MSAPRYTVANSMPYDRHVTDVAGRQRFSVDIQGLLEALTEQFPEPLLCVRELVQNAADAGAQRIEVDVSYDASRQLFRIAVRDDGRGMSEPEVEGYLTIGFSEKDPGRQRGRFGVGKLSPYALDIVRMVVETCDGQVAHRLTFNGDGSGQLARVDLRPRGTVVRVYKETSRTEAEQLTQRTFALVEERCGSIGIPLFVNGQRVNREIGLPTPYAWSFTAEGGVGVIGLCAEPIQELMGGGIVLETGAPILGEEISYVLDSPRLAPTLSRNAVRRDQAFDQLLRAAQAAMPAFTEKVAEALRDRVEALRAQGGAIERSLDPADRSALEWLRQQLLTPDDEGPSLAVKSAPVLETADGGLVSAKELAEVIRREGRVPSSRVPHTREELSAYADRGVPVLLLYRDLEDFLERQGIPTVEVDGADDGLEVSPGQWSPGEAALARRPALPSPQKRWTPAVVVSAAALVAVVATYTIITQRTPVDPVVVGAPGAGPAALPSPTSPTVTVASGGPEASPHRVGEPAAVAPEVSPGAAQASLTPPTSAGPRRFRGVVVSLAAIVAFLSTALGAALLYFTFVRRSGGPRAWLQAEADAPLMVGENRSRRWDVLRRALLHPIDFFVARGWSIRASGTRPLSASAGITGYRELAPELPIRSGVRLDLDRIEIGFVDLVSTVGEPHDGRILLRRGLRALLNRNHPTVRDLIAIAEVDPRRARVLLEALLATDPDLARGSDPRQVEWDLLGRAEHGLRGGQR